MQWAQHIAYSYLFWSGFISASPDTTLQVKKYVIKFRRKILLICSWEKAGGHGFYHRPFPIVHFGDKFLTLTSVFCSPLPLPGFLLPLPGCIKLKNDTTVRKEGIMHAKAKYVFSQLASFGMSLLPPSAILENRDFTQFHFSVCVSAM